MKKGLIMLGIAAVGGGVAFAATRSRTGVLKYIDEVAKNTPRTTTVAVTQKPAQDGWTEEYSGPDGVVYRRGGGRLPDGSYYYSPGAAGLTGPAYLVRGVTGVPLQQLLADGRWTPVAYPLPAAADKVKPPVSPIKTTVAAQAQPKGTVKTFDPQSVAAANRADNGALVAQGLPIDMVMNTVVRAAQAKQAEKGTVSGFEDALLDNFAAIEGGHDAEAEPQDP